MKNFWAQLARPFFVLAPMYDVTDAVFRQCIALCGKPDVMFTEFVCVDGLVNEKSRQRMIDYHLRYAQSERPLVAQIWGNDPEKFLVAAKIISELGFDGIDINMGCPDKKVIKNEGGGALINNPERAIEIIKATQEGAKTIPVSVKTRIGFHKENVVPWVEKICSAKPYALTLHARTVSDMSRPAANWKYIQDAVSVAAPFKIPVIGNGDIKTREEGEKYANETGADGVMVGRGVLGNYWFFNKDRKKEDVPVEEKLRMVARHAQMFEDAYVKTDLKRFHMMRKHFAAYATGFKGARELRADLMNAQTAVDAQRIIEGYVQTIKRESI